MVEKDFVLEEYKQLWSYYHKLLDERKNLLDWYFKVVTLPLGLVGFFVSTKSEQISLPHEIGATILVLIYFVGLALFGAYSKETSNAKKYHTAMVSLRNHINVKFPNLKGAIVIDELRSVDSKILNLGSTAFWRISPLMLINSAVAVASLKLFLIETPPLMLSFVFIDSVVLHYFLYKLLYATHSKKLA